MPPRVRLRQVVPAIVTIAAVAAVIIVLLARGAGTSDEQAVRAWFQTPAGGGVPANLVSSIHVDACELTADSTEAREVVKCVLTTDAPTPNLGTCFELKDGKVTRGGWQLAALDACNSLRFDARARDLVDVASHAHYPVTE